MTKTEQQLYCHACRQKHRGLFQQWPEENWFYCEKARFRIRREGHPAYRQCVEKIYDRDCTGSSTAMVKQRPDYRAMHNVATMMRNTESCGSAERRIYLLPFLMQVYWAEPMIELYVAVKKATISDTLCKE